MNQESETRISLFRTPLAPAAVHCSALVTLGAAALTACVDAPSGEQSQVLLTASDSAGIALVDISGNVEDLPVWSVAPEPAADIPGDAEPFLGSVGQVAFLSDGRLLVEDSQSDALYLFDADGSDYAVLGTTGDGPGEFRDVTALSVTPGDTSFVYDRRHNRFSVFGPSGDLERTVTVNAGVTSEGATPRAAWALNQGKLLVHVTSPLAVTDSSESMLRDQRDVWLYSLDGSGNPQGQPHQAQGGYSIRGMISGRGIIIVAPFANVPVLAPGRGSMVHGSGIEYDLIVSSANLEPRRIIRWPGWRRAVSGEVLNAVRSQAEAQFADLRTRDPQLASEIVGAMLSEELLPTTLPALGAALVDDEDRIWVSEFRPSTDRWNQRDAWHVLGVDGTPLARVQLPERSRLAAVHRDHVALVTRDDLDLQRLQVLALMREGPS